MSKKIFLSAESGLARSVGYFMFSLSLGSGIYRAPTRKGATVESTKESFRVLTSQRLQWLTSSPDIILLHCDFFKKKTIEALASADGEKNWIRWERVSGTQDGWKRDGAWREGVGVGGSTSQQHSASPLFKFILPLSMKYGCGQKCTCTVRQKVHQQKKISFSFCLLVLQVRRFLPPTPPSLGLPLVLDPPKKRKRTHLWSQTMNSKQSTLKLGFNMSTNGSWRLRFTLSWGWDATKNFVHLWIYLPQI